MRRAHCDCRASVVLDAGHFGTGSVGHGEHGGLRCPTGWVFQDWAVSFSMRIISRQMHFQNTSVVFGVSHARTITSLFDFENRARVDVGLKSNTSPRIAEPKP